MINAELNDICERIARLETERKEIATEIGDMKESAKAKGYDTALITRTVRMMMLTPKKREAALTQLSLFDTYLSAVGLLPDFDPEQQRLAELEPPPPSPEQGEQAGEDEPTVTSSPVAYDPMTGEIDAGPVPEFLRRGKRAEAMQ